MTRKGQGLRSQVAACGQSSSTMRGRLRGEGLGQCWCPQQPAGQLPGPGLWLGCDWQRSLCRGKISRILIEGDCEGLGKGWGIPDAGQRVNTVNPNGDSVLTVLQSIRAEIWAMGRQAERWKQEFSRPVRAGSRGAGSRNKPMVSPGVTEAECKSRRVK